MQKLHNVLLGVSILPALLVMPAMGDPVQVNDWIGLRNGLMNAETTAMALTGNITAGDFDSDVERMLHGDIQADGFWVLGNKTVDLNGYTIDGNDVNRQISIRSDNTLTLTGGGTVSNLSYTTGNYLDSQASPIFVAVRSTLELANGDYTFENNQSRFGIINVNNNHTDGTTSLITNNIGNLTFTGNTSTDQGGVLYLSGSSEKPTELSLSASDKIEFNNNSVTNASRTGHGGAIMNMSTNASLSANVVEFTNNRVEVIQSNLATDLYKSGGGAIQNAYSGNLTVGKAGGTVNFSHNSSTTNGGALLNRGEAQTNFLGTVVFDDNEASVNGGAIYNISTSNQTISDALFTNNTADQYGGAIYNTGDITVSNTTFGGFDATNVPAGNSADEGGAIYNNGALTFSGPTLFANNTASNFGGAIKNFYGDLTFNGAATFNNNSVTGTGQGGALHNLSATTTFNNGVTFSGNTASSYGAAIYNALNHERVGIVNINGDSLFENNTSGRGGTVFNLNGTIAFADGDAAFRGNTGGAVSNSSNMTFTNMGDILFQGNTTSLTGSDAKAAGLLNAGTLTMSADTVTFKNNVNTGANSTGKIYGALGNTSSSSDLTITANDISFESNTGGAIYKENDMLTLTATNSITFTDNNTSLSGAAISNNGNTSKTVLNADEIEFSDNISTGSYGGAIFNSGNYIKVLGATNTFSSNRAESTTNTVKYGGGAINNRGNAASTQITTAEIGLANGSSENTFADNYSGAHGGAIHARAEGQNDKGAVTILGATEFSRNSARLNGGAISNSPVSGQSTVTLTGSGVFTDNMAGGLGGAIYNTGTTNVNATAGNVTFNGNMAGVEFDNAGNVVAGSGVANDIYNTGTVTLNAADGRIIALNGGIDGVTNGTTTGMLNVTGTGTVNVANTLKNQTVNVSNGELHLNNVDLTGTTVNVASTGTINTIDNLINDFMTNSTVILADGASVKGDIDYVAGVADTYATANGANITYAAGNALNLSGTQYGNPKEVRVASTGSTVNEALGFAWYNSVSGLTLTSGGSGTGTVIVAGTAGGINAAVDDTNEGAQEIAYTLTAASEAFDGSDNTIQNANFTITGNGNDTASNQLVLASDLVVDGTSTLNLNDVVLAQSVGTETIQNSEGGNLVINDSRIAVNINNAGTLNSDPTYYGAEVVNSGIANFDGDIFESTSSLTNNGGEVNLTAVEFKAGSTIDGDGTGTINIKNGQTTFAGTVANNDLTMTNGATVVVAGTGSIDGLALETAGGNVNLQNGKIDSLGAVTANADVTMSMDANLANGTIDNVAGLTGAGALVVDNIDLAASAYADSGSSVTMTVANGGGNVTLADDFTVTGGNNYFTKVTANAGDVMFSDKLMNTSGMHSQLGDWTTGNYITASSTYDTATDAYTTQGQTVGAALTALDTQANTNAVAIANEKSRAEAAEGALNTRLVTAEGAITTLTAGEDVDGSVANTAKEYADTALNTAKTYADSINSLSLSYAASHDALTLNQANAYTDKRIEKLDKNLSAGVAGAVALSSVAISNVRRGEVSVGAGYGYFNGQSAGAFGAAMGLSNRWSINAGAGVSGYDVAFRAGTNYKFRLFK